MVTSPSLLELLQSGVHFGHRQSKWHPKMERYIYTSRGGIHIINLEETAKKLEVAMEFIRSVAARDGLVVFVGTKRQAVGPVYEAAQLCNMPWVNARWLGGTLTNFNTIRRMVDQYLTNKQNLASGDLDKYTKKERLIVERKVKKAEVIVGGLAALRKIPDAMIVVDVKNERTAINEARKMGVPVIAMCDTNINPELVNFPIPANDDAVKSIELITRLLAEAYNEGKLRAADEKMKAQDEVAKSSVIGAVSEKVAA